MTLPLTPLAFICFALLAVGFCVVGALSLLPATRAKARPIWPILLTEALIVGMVAGAALAGGMVLLVAVLALAARVAYEAISVATSRRGQEAWIPAIGWTLLCALAMALPFPWLALSVLAAAVALFMFRRRIWANLALFPGLPLILYCGAAAHGMAPLLLAAFLLVETFDSYALLGGKLFGRTLAFPTLSPKKTIEGLGLGAFMLVITAAIVGPFLLGASLWTSIGAAALAGVFSVSGDLAASRIKRAAGVKDYPQVLPHQGGLFDIADAWITTGAGFAVLAALL